MSINDHFPDPPILTVACHYILNNLFRFFRLGWIAAMAGAMGYLVVAIIYQVVLACGAQVPNETAQGFALLIGGAITIAMFVYLLGDKDA